MAVNIFQKILSFFGLGAQAKAATTPAIEAAITKLEASANTLLSTAEAVEADAGALAQLYPPAAGAVATITAITAGLKTALTTAEALITSIENSPAVTGTTPPSTPPKTA